MSVRIITDSASDFAADDPRVTVLPLTVTFGDAVYRDGVDITNERFYELLVEGDNLPVTSQVNPFGFSQAIEAVRAEGAEGIVIITLSSKISGTYESACIAAHEAGGEDAGVFVVDSHSATVGEHIQVEHALKRAEEGASAADIARELICLRERVVLVALLDTLEYLRRGGRVPAAAAAIGELLAIKPVISLEGGEVVVRGKARGSKNGRNLLNREVENARGIDFSMPVRLGYTGLSDKLLRKYIEDSRSLWEGNLDADQLPVDVIGATIGTHAGPGAVAVAFFRNA